MRIDDEPSLLEQANAEILTALVKLGTLNAWERNFVRWAASHKNLSRRQQDDLMLLRDKYLTKESNT